MDIQRLSQVQLIRFGIAARRLEGSKASTAATMSADDDAHRHTGISYTNGENPRGHRFHALRRGQDAQLGRCANGFIASCFITLAIVFCIFVTALV